MTIEKEIDESINEIDQKSKEFEDPNAFKARLLSRMERELLEDKEYREG